MPSVLLGQKGASHNTSSELINPLFGWRIDPEIETLAGSAGTALAMMLFLSPLPTFRKMVADGTTSDFLPDPYLSALCNCGLWVVYAVPSVTPNRLLPLACNCAGVLLQLVYAVVFGMYVAPATRWRYRIMLFITVVMLSVVAVVVFMFDPDPSNASETVGAMAMGFNILMYASPLTVCMKVVKTKSVEFMPLPLSLCTLMCSIFWAVYGVYMGDINIMPPNLCGVVFGTGQLVLYACYCGGPPDDGGLGEHSPLSDRLTTDSDGYGVRRAGTYEHQGS